MSETTHVQFNGNKLKQPNYPRRQKVAMAIAGLITAGSIFGVNKLLEDNTVKHRNKVEQEALSKADSAWNNLIALFPGVKLRSSPEMIPQGSDNSNVVDEVKAGQVLRIDKPIAVQVTGPTGQKETWFGFTRTDTDDASRQNTDMDRYLWVDFNVLDAQNRNGDAKVQVYDYPEVLDGSFDPVIDLSPVAPNERFYDVGFAQLMNEKAFEQHIADHRLTLSHK